ncbi:putative periplasmic binding protein-like I [Rosa chinensis]|uniref:Putative periplasmic binding protein-like I n=1 Tax=Rosa chinensis TaxID=74649 RepID=A0A2P6SMI5_ROSCH|nr:putative periplasmic binding protein-like I [Rosa chinensis]
MSDMTPLGLGVSPKHELGMMKEGYVWIMTNGLTSLLSNGSVINSMQGALGVRVYVPKTDKLIDFRARWKRKFQQENPTICSMAVENVATRSTFGFRKTNDSINSSADLETLRVSRKGLEISKFLSSTRFRGGIAGDFSFVNGQLQSPMFEIVNVNGNGVRGIGFWTPQRGLVKSSNVHGWEVPTNGKKLRVGVPVKIGSPELVKVVRNPVTNGTEVTEFCIDIIKAVMEGLPYAVTYDFIPFAKPDGTTAGSYNDLVHQAFLGLKSFQLIYFLTSILHNNTEMISNIALL